MLRSILTSAFIILFSFSSFSQATHTINIDGFTFSPDNITVEPGDTVFFNGNSSHPVLEVSKDTWAANGDTPLSGGFSFPSGKGKQKFNEAGTFYYICENHVSSGMKGTINVSAATSSENFNIEGFKIYPNPLNSAYLTILLPPGNDLTYKFTIYDLTGRVKAHKIVPQTGNEAKIDCSNLVPGAYVVKIQNNNTVYTSKFIKG